MIKNLIDEEIGNLWLFIIFILEVVSVKILLSTLYLSSRKLLCFCCCWRPGNKPSINTIEYKHTFTWGSDSKTRIKLKLLFPIRIHWILCVVLWCIYSNLDWREIYIFNSIFFHNVITNVKPFGFSVNKLAYYFVQIG